MAVFSLKIAPKHDTKTRHPSIPAVTAEMGGFSMIRRHHAENEQETEVGAVLLPQ
jgi:hypothetical protein